MSTPIRFEIISSRFDKGRLLVSGKGLAGEVFKDIPFIQPHGFASVPPAGAIGQAQAMSGRRSQMTVVGIESAQNRPDVPAGASALYDAHGNIIKLFAEGVEMDFGSRTITMMGGSWNLTGDLTITGNIEVTGNIHATGTIIDDSGNTNHHSH